MDPAPRHPALLSRGRRLLLLLPPLSYVALWWATAVWGVPQVEREVVARALKRSAERAMGAPVKVVGTSSIRTYAPFPLVVRCELDAIHRLGANRTTYVADRGLHFWLFR